MARAEQEIITAVQAKSLIGSQFPPLRPLRLARLGVGWDNAVFRVNERYVFRFPIRDIAAPLLEMEAVVLPRLAGRLPLPIPRPVFVGRPSKDFPWPFIGYRIIAGRSASAVRLTDEQRTASAKVLGRFFKALHSLPPTFHRGAGADALRRLDIGHRVAMTLPRLRSLVRLGLLKESRTLAAFLRRARPADGADVPLHGDPHAGQLLVDEHGAVCGVIDWGDLHVGHPAVDLSLAQTFLPPSAHGVFREAYGGVAEPVWRLARFRGICVMAALAEYAHEHRDAVMLNVGLTGLRFIIGGKGSTAT